MAAANRKAGNDRVEFASVPFIEFLLAALLQNENVILVGKECQRVKVRLLSFVMTELQLLTRSAIMARDGFLAE